MISCPLPDFIVDLSFTLGGKTLSAFAFDSDPKMIHFGLEPYKHSNWGLFIHTDGNYAELKCGQALTRWHNGKTITYTPYDGDDEPQWWEAAPFEIWVRKELLKEIERIIMTYLKRYLGTHGMSRDLDMHRKLYRDFAHLPDFKMSRTYGCSFIFRMLGAVSRAFDSVDISADDHAIFEEFFEIQSAHESPQIRSLADKVIMMTLNALPELPIPFQEGVEFRLSEISSPILRVTMEAMAMKKIPHLS